MSYPKAGLGTQSMSSPQCLRSISSEQICSFALFRHFLKHGLTMWFRVKIINLQDQSLKCWALSCVPPPVLPYHFSSLIIVRNISRIGVDALLITHIQASKYVNIYGPYQMREDSTGPKRPRDQKKLFPSRQILLSLTDFMTNNHPLSQ